MSFTDVDNRANHEDPSFRIYRRTIEIISFPVKFQGDVDKSPRETTNDLSLKG